MAFTVLFVCTGNICRSPMAERLLQARLDGTAPIQVSSAGTRALVGRSIEGPSATALRELGGNAEGHVARQLTTGLVAKADLVLTAASVHCAAIVQADPRAFRTAFTVREFGRLGASLGPLDGPATDGVLRERVAQVAGQRGWVQAAEPGADEIGDPFGAPLDIARHCAAQLAQAVDGVVSALGLHRERCSVTRIVPAGESGAARVMTGSSVSNPNRSNRSRIGRPYRRLRRLLATLRTARSR